MGGVTHKIEEAVKALEKGQVKKALWLTDTTKTQRHHRIVEDAARKCLTDKEQCSVYFKDAAEKLLETITAPLDETDLEGVEEMIGESEKPAEQVEKTEDELYAECEECHVVDAVIKFHEVSAQCSPEATQRIERLSADENTAPEKWLKELKQIKNDARCGRGDYEEIWDELTSYLRERDSPILKGLEESNG